MRRRRLLLGVGAVVLLVAGFVLWITRPVPAVTWENFHHLRLGMSLRAVKALLGEPNEQRIAMERVGIPASGILTGLIWRGEEIVIALRFDQDRLYFGNAASREEDFGAGHVELVPPDNSLLDRIRRWLDW